MSESSIDSFMAKKVTIKEMVIVCMVCMALLLYMYLMMNKYQEAAVLVIEKYNACVQMVNVTGIPGLNLWM